MKEQWVQCDKNEAEIIIDDIDERLYFNARRKSDIPLSRKHSPLYLKRTKTKK